MCLIDPRLLDSICGGWPGNQLHLSWQVNLDEWSPLRVCMIGECTAIRPRRTCATDLLAGVLLRPAELPKQAASFDLPITLGVLAASGQLTSDRFEQYAVVGELSLEGRTRPAKGVLSMAISAARNTACAGSSYPTRMRTKPPWSRSWK